jgi:archaellum component FlaF (FlaF/FlaG flagellin family)
MTSPFSGFDNSTLTFKVADGTYITNAVGNRSLNTKPEIIKAVLKPATDTSTVNRYANEIQQFAGADGHAVLLEGYLVEPQVYPQGIEFLMEADIEITVVINKPETGRIKLLPVVQSPYVVAMGIDAITPIRGVFRRN